MMVRACPPPMNAEIAELVATLQEIASRLPTTSAESETAWSNRAWCGEFRDLQRIARTKLEKLGYPVSAR